MVARCENCNQSFFCTINNTRMCKSCFVPGFRAKHSISDPKLTRAHNRFMKEWVAENRSAILVELVPTEKIKDPKKRKAQQKRFDLRMRTGS